MNRISLDTAEDVFAGSASTVSAEKLPFRTKVFYGSGTVAFGIKDQGFSALLMLYYNQVIGLPAAWVGTAIMIAMVFDALVDPLLGQFSDSTRSRWGRRHPFMYASVLPIGISYLLLWTPPAVSQHGQFAYLVVTAIAVRFSISLYEIPSTALLSEFSRDYDERTKLVAYRYFFGVLGGIAMTVVTFKYFLAPTATQPNGALNATGYVTYGWVAAGLMLLSVLISTLGTHHRIPSLQPAESVLPENRMSIRQTVKAMKEILFDSTYASILLASLFFAIASGLMASLGVYFSTYVWGLNSGEIALVSSGAVVGILLAFVVALPLSRRFGKKHTAIGLFVASMIAGVLPLALHGVNLFPSNGSPALIPILLVQVAFSTMCTIAASILAVSMVADVGEHVQMKTGRRSEGLLFSAVIMVNKAVSGMGVFSAGLLLGLVKFPEHATPGAVPDSVLYNLVITYISAMTVVTSLAIVCLWFYPITRSQHAEAVRQLDQQS